MAQPMIDLGYHLGKICDRVANAKTYNERMENLLQFSTEMQGKIILFDSVGGIQTTVKSSAKIESMDFVLTMEGSEVHEITINFNTRWVCGEEVHNSILKFARWNKDTLTIWTGWSDITTRAYFLQEVPD